MTIDIRLDPLTNDLDLINNTLTLTTSIEEVTRQQLWIALSTYKGEWDFNIDFGVPYLANNNNPIQLLGVTSKTLVDLTLKEVILQNENVLNIQSYESIWNKPEGTFTVSFSVEVENGSTVIINNFSI